MPSFLANSITSIVVDMIQGGAGTSTNMNANEVIANIGLELMGHQKGEYKFLHPNNDVNLSQSTNDAYPTALRVALYEKLGELGESMKIIKDHLQKKQQSSKMSSRWGEPTPRCSSNDTRARI